MKVLVADLKKSFVCFCTVSLLASGLILYVYPVNCKYSTCTSTVVHVSWLHVQACNLVSTLSQQKFECPGCVAISLLPVSLVELRMQSVCLKKPCGYDEHCVARALMTHFGYSSFREGQLEAMLPIMHGQDVFARMATGAGKSLCMFLPPLAWSPHKPAYWVD